MKTTTAICAALLGTSGATLCGVASAENVEPKRLSEIVRILASDEFEGRSPGTPGETKTIEYLVDTFKRLGLEPGGAGGGWTQQVPLLRTQIEKPRTLQVSIDGKVRPLTQAKDIYVSTIRDSTVAKIDNAALVFVGYGVTAPERQWDDYKGVDLKGKIAVSLVNDPDFSAAEGEAVAGKFGARRMTYYGRWSYKFEEATRRGAIASLIVHDTEGAGYGWSTVVAPGGGNFALVETAAAPSTLRLQGWLEGNAAAELFRSAGLDLAALRAQARRADFKPVELKGVTLSADVPVTTEKAVSRNVLAKITGSEHPDETIMMAAHWDAYGMGPPDAQGRKVRPGANDDALGVAGVIELARVFKSEPRPKRTLVFAAWTAEERGLIGSQAYAARPIYPLPKTVANLTLDILQTAGLARDVLLVGAGQSDLEEDLARAAATQDRTITPETLPERGLFYRADHFPLARQGVPVLLLMALSGAPDMREGGRAAGDKWLTDYMRCYHQTCDTWDPNWDLRGAAQDVELFHTIARDLANSRRWPQWRADSEFHAIREQSKAQRSTAR
ncbi:M20/M25/M40 family metallo-hydrolase [Steroidobacter sp. S1-65]|uniref:M20/M25/M40 family metallo-hydrolase n=1 Tax=Steroidobacter gossypii TaxID=2805490 RepID=A0ABS1WYF1_9GAMM|nr:M28 family metallopeptidase [Steroidobacter gossypii]MBM0106012.1 M20/M25/M40 family metallo-hydrolase [Steroidobacter gossypii]